MIGIVVYIVWVTYCVLEGMRDAYMYNVKDPMRRNDFNEHYIFTAQRTLVLGILVSIWWQIIIIGPLAFSFFHNGMYYTCRHWLDNRLYPETWFDQSYTSTAKTTEFFTPGGRTIFFVLSLITLAVINFALWNEI